MNKTGAPLGREVAGFIPPPRPARAPLQGRNVRLEPMEIGHAGPLFEAFTGHDHLWDYMPYGPFAAASAHHRWVKETALGEDPFFYAIRDRATGHVQGQAAFLNVNPAQGSIEVGHICLAPAMQRAVAASEAMMLMMSWAMDAGYRRYEWKCNALNMPSRRAAQRLGFSFEGVFRNHLIVKGRNRDTAWFAVTDGDWPALREAYSAWSAPSNFDAAGRQKERLSDLTALVRVAGDPAL